MIERIVVLHDFCVPRGGASLLAVRSAVELRRRGFAVSFLSGDDGINPALADLGVATVGLGERPALKSAPAKTVFKALYNAAAAAMVSAWIDRHDTPNTVYHMHNWGQILSPSVLRPLSRVKSRLVLSAHDFFHVCPNGSYSFLKSGEVCALTPMSARCIASDCDSRNYAFKLWRVARQAVRNHVFDTGANVPLLVIHDRMRPFFRRAGVPDAQIVTVPNPVEPFTAERVAVERNSEIFFVGRLETTKGPDLAAAAARRADVPLRLIGEGALRPQLESAYPEAVLEGHRPRAALSDLLGRARALIMPSRYPEPYGLVAVEALWSGLPVIISDTAFLAQDIVAAEAGLAVDPRDTAATAAAIRRIAFDDAVATAMSHNAMARTRHLANTTERWLDRLVAIYRDRLR